MLCTHPDLPGQVADLIHPDGHPGWVPVEPAEGPTPGESTTPNDPEE